MSQRKRPDALQSVLDLGTPFPELSDGMLEGIERRVARSIAKILREDIRPRVEVAAGVSGLLAAPVSKAMLDGYASEARPTHNISAGRFIALIAESRRFDILSDLLAEISVKAVAGEDVLKLELGLIEADIAHKGRRRSQLKRIMAAVETKGGMQ